MKKLLYIFIALFSLTFVACSSDDNSPSGGNNTPDGLYLKFTADGVDYNFEPATLTSLQKHIMGYTGTDEDHVRLSLWMPVEPTVGTHQLTDDFPTDDNLDTHYSGFYYKGDMTFDSTSGTITISTIDDEYITGTFSFTGTDFEGNTVAITNGSFKAYN